MGKYIAKRIGYMALVFLIVSFLMYSLYNLIPTDPARAELEAQKQSLKPAEYEQLYQELRAKMGLDDPLVIRYMRWMGLWPEHFLHHSGAGHHHPAGHFLRRSQGQEGG